MHPSPPPRTLDYRPEDSIGILTYPEMSISANCFGYYLDSK